MAPAGLIFLTNPLKGQHVSEPAVYIKSISPTLERETHVELIIFHLHHKSIPVLFLHIGWLLRVNAPFQVFLHLNQELVLVLSVTRRNFLPCIAAIWIKVISLLERERVLALNRDQGSNDYKDTR